MAKKKPNVATDTESRAASVVAAMAAATREFKRICPTLELVGFGELYARYYIIFSGAESELLELGVVTTDMIPVKPDRKRRTLEGEGHYVWRRAGGRLEVSLPLNEFLPRSHPLAALTTYGWPFVDAERPRPSLRIVVNNEFAGGCTA
jgi:hypothetical protein